MNVLVWPHARFTHVLADLALDPNRVAAVRVGGRRAGDSREWLVRDARMLNPGETASSLGRSSIEVVLADRLPSSLLAPTPGVDGRLVLGNGPWRGHFCGVFRTLYGLDPVDRLDLVGPGMHRILAAARDLEPGPSFDPIRGRWSRTAAALGGDDIRLRLVRLHVGVVGCGRSGSLLVAALARLGLQRITLIDPDFVEEHCLGEMDVVTGTDLGRPKAEALADRLGRVSGGTTAITSVVASVAEPVGRAAAAGCDVLACCADSDAARLACALLATLYHRVLLDIGTGIDFPADAGANSAGSSPSRPRPRVMGADVRLIVPGDRCLLCYGHLARYGRAFEDLVRPDRVRSRVVPADAWRRQRGGSLAALNALAVAINVAMLQDFVAERLRASTWVRAEYDAAGHLAVHQPEPTTGGPPCALCAKAGLGDDGLGTSP